jgi:hypothetical protein
MELACGTFPGCTLAKDDGEHVVKGLIGKVDGDYEKALEELAEPLRAGTWYVNLMIYIILCLTCSQATE